MPMLRELIKPGCTLDVGKNIVRIAWVLLTLFYGLFLILYIACAFIIPEDDGTIDAEYEEKN